MRRLPTFALLLALVGPAAAGPTDAPDWASHLHVVRVGDPDTSRWQVVEGLRVRQGPSADPLVLHFE